MALSYRLKDPSRTFTPNGRPRKKPVKIVMRLASRSSVGYSGNLEDLLVLERPLKKSLHSHNVGLQDCMNSRPPLRLDMAGPTPCTYSTIPPPSAANGILINPKTKHRRGALPFPNSEVWTYNVACNDKTPTPCTYTSLGMIGRCCPTKRDAPAHTMGAKRSTLFGRTGASKEPSPNTYDSAAAMDATKRHFPSYTISSFSSYRRNSNSTPGPAHYRPDYERIHHKSPSYTMRTRIRTSTI